MARPVLIAFALAVACKPDARQLGEKSALSATALANVLGADGSVRADSLRTARGPGLQFAEYGGYSERIDSGVVSYRFHATQLLATKVSPNARPYLVSLSREFPTEAAALTYWRSAIERMTRQNGEPLICHLIAGNSPGRSALWQTGSLYIQISVRRPIDIGPTVVPDRVIVGVARYQLWSEVGGAKCKEVIAAL